MASVGEVLVEGLKARGVEVVFGIPGVHTVELYRGLPGSGIRHVTARHEGGAAFMADGYARASGKPGVAFVISGPGLTNALTAMGQSRQDSAPVLIISGVNRRDSLGLGLGYLHELPDQAGMVRTLCPSFQVTSPEALETVLNQAFACLYSGRPGPVHIEVPTDVMPLPCPPLSQTPQVTVTNHPAPELVEAAAALLNRAKRPVILVGGGARYEGPSLRALAEMLDAPVVQTVNARGVLWGHALSVPATAELDAVRALIRDSDQILALGTELGLTDYDSYGRGNVPDLSGMIRVDICAQQMARHPTRLGLVADAGKTMRALLPLLKQKRADGAARTAEALASARKEMAERMPKLAEYLPYVEAIRTAMPQALIVGDSTQPVYAGNILYDHDRPGGWFNAATGFGSLGFGPGAAVGAAMACPGADVVCLVGDGGLQFSPGELRTAVDENLPVTFLVWNSASYQEIADYMEHEKITVLGCDPSPLKMRPFAEACDLPFQSVGMDPAALAEALRSPHIGPRMIEVRVV